MGVDLTESEWKALRLCSEMTEIGFCGAEAKHDKTQLLRLGLIERTGRARRYRITEAGLSLLGTTREAALNAGLRRMFRT